MDPELNSVHLLYSGILNGMDIAAARHHPFEDPSRWSAQQVVEHLILTYRSTAETLRERLQKGRPTQAPVTLHYRVAQLLVLKVGWYPRDMKAPCPVCPGHELSQLGGFDLADKMREELQAMDRILNECERQFGRGKVASHFALGPLTVQQWRHFHAFHGRHHLKQLRLCAAVA
jgi:hypothetical protein